MKPHSTLKYFFKLGVTWLMSVSTCLDVAFQNESLNIRQCFFLLFLLLWASPVKTTLAVKQTRTPESCLWQKSKQCNNSERPEKGTTLLVYRATDSERVGQGYHQQLMTETTWELRRSTRRQQSVTSLPTSTGEGVNHNPLLQKDLRRRHSGHNPKMQSARQQKKINRKARLEFEKMYRDGRATQVLEGGFMDCWHRDETLPKGSAEHPKEWWRSCLGAGSHWLLLERVH